MSDLVFREDDHSYHYRGRRVPSVSELLRPVTNYGNSSWAAADLGTAVHDATALDDYGDLDEETVAPEVWPYLDAWRAFRTGHILGFEAIEQVVHNRSNFSYAGTLDRVARVVWPRGNQPCLTVIDLKTGALRPWYELQLYAYALAYQPSLETIQAGIVQLAPEGTFAFYAVDLGKPGLYAKLVALREVWAMKQEYRVG